MNSLDLFTLGVLALYLLVGTLCAWIVRGELGVIPAVIIMLTWPIFIVWDL